MIPIDYLRVDDLPWTDGGALAAGEPPRVKLLRVGAAGDLTAVVELAPGGRWTAAAGQLVSFLVLGGRLTGGDRLHGHLGFGQARGDGSVTWTAPDGARLLVFQQPGDDPAGLVDAVDTLDADWQVAEDPVAGIWRELTLTQPGNPAGAIALRSLAIGDASIDTHRHDWDEEVFVVDGERRTPVGIMTAGCYAWRPRGLWHGGFRTGSPGALLLVRRTGEPAALAAVPRPAAATVPATPLRREARLLPAAAATADLLHDRATLTGRRE